MGGYSTNCSTHEWTDQIGHNLKAIMKVMRLANKRGRNLLNINSLIENKNNELKYPMASKGINSFQSQNQDSFVEIDVNSMIPWCWKRQSSSMDHGMQLCHKVYKECQCDLFEPVITDHGMCHSFNPVSTLG